MANPARPRRTTIEEIVVNYVVGLPRLSTHKLKNLVPPDSDCLICRLPYRNTRIHAVVDRQGSSGTLVSWLTHVLRIPGSPELNTNGTEEAVVLKCRHVCGDECLMEWLMVKAIAAEIPTCPYCRQRIPMTKFRLVRRNLVEEEGERREEEGNREDGPTRRIRLLRDLRDLRDRTQKMPWRRRGRLVWNRLRRLNPNDWAMICMKLIVWFAPLSSSIFIISAGSSRRLWDALAVAWGVWGAVFRIIWAGGNPWRMLEEVRMLWRVEEAIVRLCLILNIVWYFLIYVCLTKELGLTI